MYDIIIIGAGPAGLTAAIYAARSGKKVLVYEKEGIGGQIAFSPRVENYPGIRSVSGAEFSDNLYEQALSFGVEIELEEVVGIEDNGETKAVVTENGKELCKKIIIATGVQHRKLGIPDEDDYVGCGVSYCAVCDGAFFKNTDVAVVGGGNAALRSAQLLAGICNKVYLIHRRNEFRGEKMIVDELESLGNVEFVLDSVVTSLFGEGDLSSVEIENRISGEHSRIDVSALFVCVGQIPSNDAFKNIVSLDENGYIIAGEDCRTNVEGVFAVGDCRTKTVRQLTTAAADGAVAALS
ncbi:MAG: thioredoxin-disulfide reductase [Ruminococcaceae bacterium]|nr:thioredoxin-disulfide reductase [Oscillospiraceae bacterium]